MSERELIVAWLRTHQGDHARVFANAIERGEHIDEMRGLANTPEPKPED